MKELIKNIVKETSEFKLIFTNSLNLLSGIYSSKIKGDGIEFIDLKEYTPGDDIRKIDWKVTARVNKPYVKEFLEEKDISHYVFIDSSKSMKNKLFFTKVLAFSLLLSTKATRDNFTIGFFNKKNKIIYPLSKSNATLMKYLYLINEIKVEEKSDFFNFLSLIANIIKKRSIISIITDELEINNDILKILKYLNKKNRVNYFCLYSSKEMTLSEGINSFEDIESGETGIYDLEPEEVVKYYNEFKKILENIKIKLKSINLNLHMLDIDKSLKGQIKKLM